MSDKIKVVYSWIGPQGPLWNTEVPNIMSLAAMTGSSHIDSRFFMGDSTWQQIFSVRPDLYEVYPSFGITENDDRPFIIPYTLMWRTEFPVYFCGRTGLLEFAHVPWHLIRLAIIKNGYILIDHGVEAIMADYDLDAMHGYFKDIHHIPLHKVIYLTGAVNAPQMYEEYCNKRGISNNLGDRLTIVPYASGGYIFKQDMANTEEPVYNTEVVPEKLFLSWNRRHRLHRVEAALYMEKLNVIDRSYVSFTRENIEMPAHTFKSAIPDNFNMETHYGITEDIINRFDSKLPLILDNATEIALMCQDSENTTRSYYENSLVSIVTETTFRDASVALTEKTFKPFKQKHPFILIAGPDALKFLHSLGFKTFNEFWSEDYDEQGGPEDRMRRIMSVMEEISKWTPEQIIDFRRRVKPILEHNYNVLKNLDVGHILTDIKTLIENYKQ